MALTSPFCRSFTADSTSGPIESSVFFTCALTQMLTDMLTPCLAAFTKLAIVMPNHTWPQSHCVKRVKWSRTSLQLCIKQTVVVPGNTRPQKHL